MTVVKYMILVIKAKDALEVLPCKYSYAFTFVYLGYLIRRQHCIKCLVLLSDFYRAFVCTTCFNKKVRKYKTSRKSVQREPRWYLWKGK